MSWEATWVYLDKHDWERAQRDLDLGECTTVEVYLFPHKDDKPDLVKFFIADPTDSRIYSGGKNGED